MSSVRVIECRVMDIIQCKWVRFGPLLQMPLDFRFMHKYIHGLDRHHQGGVLTVG